MNEFGFNVHRWDSVQSCMSKTAWVTETTSLDQEEKQPHTSSQKNLLRKPFALRGLPYSLLSFGSWNNLIKHLLHRTAGSSKEYAE